MSLILRQWQPIGDDEIMTNTLWQWLSDRQWQWQSDDCNEQLQSLGVIGPIGSICVSCQALLAQVTWAVAFSLCWRFQPWTLSDFWWWWWTKRRRWWWQKFQSLEHLILDVKTHSARKGKNRLYVTFKVYPGEVHDVHHIRVGLVRDRSTFSNTGFL